MLFPSVCPVCNESMMDGEKTLCTKCRLDMPLTYCSDNPYNNTVTELFSGIIPIESGIALFYYDRDSKYKMLIHNMKYRGFRNLGVELGELLGHELVESGVAYEVDAIVPIPIHPIRFLKRGYNQSQQICNGIRKTCELPIISKAVVRKRNNKSQVRRQSKDRLRNTAGIFSVTSPAELSGKHILIIDDVLTTGATVESCAREILAKCTDVRISVATLSVSNYRSKR